MKCNIGATYMKFSPMLASVNLCTTHVRCLNNAIDSRVTLTGDFVGIKPSSDTMFSKKEKNPVVAIAKLQEELHLNQRLKAHSFVTSILQPLEKKQEPFCSILKNSADSYAPAILKMCGLGMTDIPAENRMLILRQLIKGMVSNGIKLSMGGINAMVQVWIENDHKFDVQELLRFVENDLKLKLDSKFFSLCAWQLARQGDYDALVNWTNHMRSYGGFEPSDSDVDLALIFCAENRLSKQLKNELLQRYLSMFSIDDTAESISVLQIAREKINEDRLIVVQDSEYSVKMQHALQLMILTLSTGVCRLQGIDDVYKFINNFRRVRVVRTDPSHSIRCRNVSKRLFLEAFFSLRNSEWKNLESCRIISSLSDFLIEEGLLNSREYFVEAGVEYFLDQSMFSEAFQFWRTQILVYHRLHGLHALVNYIVGRYDEHEGVCKDRIVEVMREGCHFMKPSEYLAIVISAMIMNGYLKDAEAFAKLFSIPACNFDYSLKKMAEQQDLNLFENFAKFLQEVYFAELVSKNNGKTTLSLAYKHDESAITNVFVGDEKGFQEISTVSSCCNFKFLLNIWKPSGIKSNKKYMKKLSKSRIHKVDIQQLENLVQDFLRIWVSTAGKLRDCNSLIRLYEFITTNQIRLKPHLVSRCRLVFFKSSRIAECPFPEVQSSSDSQYKIIPQPKNP